MVFITLMIINVLPGTARTRHLSRKNDDPKARLGTSVSKHLSLVLSMEHSSRRVECLIALSSHLAVHHHAALNGHWLPVIEIR